MNYVTIKLPLWHWDMNIVNSWQSELQRTEMWLVTAHTLLDQSIAGITTELHIYSINVQLHSNREPCLKHVLGMNKEQHPVNFTI
jgi:hypothetical protein